MSRGALPSCGQQVLITGLAGFCGSHLAELLLESDVRVAGIDVEQAGTMNLAPFVDRLDLHWADIRDGEEVRRIVAEVSPEQIYHLAAATGGQEDSGYRVCYETNLFGTINLLEAVRAERPDCSVLIAGSSAQYGLADGQYALREMDPFRPVTHYAVSKAAQEMVGHRYSIAAGLRVVRIRAFNIIGPRQSPRFVGSALARQVAEIEHSLREPVIQVGNLESKRDFLDVRDAVRAYILALSAGEPGQVYNVCSGQARSIRSLLEGLLNLSTAFEIEVRQDPLRIQEVDVPVQVGDFHKLRHQTGWNPQIAFEQTLRNLLDYWRERVSEEIVG